ncbi:4121_t:CDS:10 [Ambispora gerdemannii]|uniref:4121_t:CDS:1 n=1 Tax=Ambispora gerdemannii TaxID=144530 RepID=A0A9N8W2L2_9GLOM|nr:4121_t:CDS:10 [Ambispora gerdemannii]
MSSASVRQPKGRRQEFNSFQNSNSNHTNRNTKKWSNNAQHPAAKHMHDRMLCLLANFVGMNVQVTIKSGTKYEGLFHTASTEGELGVVLKLARKVLTKAEEKAGTPNKVISTFIIMAKDCMAIEATCVDFSASEKNLTSERDSFRTDADISGGRIEPRERELHKWNPDEHGGGEALAGQDNASAVTWDQFAVNEQLFGIRTDFNEEFYTTKLDRTKPDFKEKERQAIQIANEITRTTTNNVHMLEERGILIEESHMDEEDKYGAVVRNRDPSKYMPPALRKLQEQQNAATVKKPELPKEPAKEVKSVVKPIPETPTVSKHGIDAHGKPIEAHGKPIEGKSQIMHNFKKFAINEKERLQQRKQAIFRKEFDGKVAELAKWGKTFKLSSPLPSDLIPILTKDESKQLKKPEIKIEEEKHNSNPEPTDIKLSSSSPPDQPPPEKPMSLNTNDKVSQSLSAGKTPATTPTNSQFKLNVRASEWRPNPNAATFTPTAPTSSAGDKRSPGSSPFFGNKQLKKSPVSLKDSFSPFQKGKLPNPSTIPPTWPFGARPFRHQFTVTNAFEDDIYNQAAMSQSFGFAYPVAAPPFRYPAATQYVNVPPITMQQAAPMPYMQPSFVPGMPFTTPQIPSANGAPPNMYNPQMSSVIPPQHFSPQGFPSPGRSPMVPAGMHPQMYYQNPHGIPVHVPPNGVMMGQRPMMMDPHYVQQPETPMGNN